MAKLSEKELTAWEKKRDLNTELLQALHDMKDGVWARKTEFTPQADGSIRRVISRRDGTIEKDDIVPAEKALRVADCHISMFWRASSASGAKGACKALAISDCMASC